MNADFNMVKAALPSPSWRGEAWQALARIEARLATIEEALQKEQALRKVYQEYAFEHGFKWMADDALQPEHVDG